MVTTPPLYDASNETFKSKWWTFFTKSKLIVIDCIKLHMKGTTAFIFGGVIQKNCFVGNMCSQQSNIQPHTKAFSFDEENLRWFCLEDDYETNYSYYCNPVLGTLFQVDDLNFPYLLYNPLIFYYFLLQMEKWTPKRWNITKLKSRERRVAWVCR